VCSVEYTGGFRKVKIEWSEKTLKDFILIMTYGAFRTYIYLFFHVVAMFLNAFLESGDELVDACV
jgi:hypothetical protein